MTTTIKIRPMPWTEQRVDMLKGLWKDGLSCAQIAREIGGVSRCAVIGKVHRLNLPARAVEHRKSTERSGRSAHSRKPRQHRTRDQLKHIKSDTGVIKDLCQLDDEPEALKLPNGEYVGALHVRDSQCRWPHGDAKLDPKSFHFCAHPKKEGSPYCLHHSGRAWQPKQKSPGEKLSIRMSAFALRAREAA